MSRIHLPAGHVLTVVANALGTGFVKRIAQSGDQTTNYSATELAAGETKLVGPFLEDQQYEIVELSGDLAVAVAPATSSGNRGIFTLAIPLQLAAMTTSAADLVTNYTPGFRGQILDAAFAVTQLGTGAGASQVLNLEIGSTDVSGGVLTLLLADATPLGKVTQATAITGNNLFSAADTISLEVAADGVVFTAGAGVLLLRLQNLDV